VYDRPPHTSKTEGRARAEVHSTATSLRRSSSHRSFGVSFASNLAVQSRETVALVYSLVKMLEPAAVSLQRPIGVPRSFHAEVGPRIAGKGTPCSLAGTVPCAGSGLTGQPRPHVSQPACVCERYVYSGTLFSLRKRRIVNFIQARPSCAFG
jgi:hypothetical protein